MTASPLALDAAADELARRLTPSLEEIWMFEVGLMWSVFRVSRAEFGDQIYVHAYRDSATLLGRC